MKKAIAVQTLDTISSSSVWMQLELIGQLSRPIAIEIGIRERTSSSLSDVCQSFRRLWAYFKEKLDNDESGSQRCFPELLPDVILRIEWRLNIYYDVDVLILAHCLEF